MKLLVFDGNSILNRAFYGVRLLTNASGIYTNAIYGFLNIYAKFMAEEKPDYVCVCFDRREPTFRHKRFEGYKAQRKGMPPELAPQLPLVKEVLAAMHVCTLEAPGFEADDIIGTLSAICEGQNCDCTIVTGDKDSLQLIGDYTRVMLTTTKAGSSVTQMMDRDAFYEKYGMEPTKIIDLKALMGDASDNIPGVASIGEKTAMALLLQYGSLDGVYKALDENTYTGKEGAKKALLSGRDSAYLSYELASIYKEVPIDFSLDSAAVRPFDRPKFQELMQYLNFKNIRLTDPGDMAETAVQQTLEIEAIAEVKYETPADYSALLQEIRAGSKFPFLWDNAGICFCAGEVLYSVAYTDDGGRRLLKEIFKDPAIKKYTHDVKSASVLLARYGISFTEAAFDTLLGAYVLDPSVSAYYLEDLKEKYIEGYQKTQNPVKELVALAAAMHEKLLGNGQQKLYYEIELPLAFVLADMEMEGFKVDKAALIQFGTELDEKIDRCTKSIYELAGEEGFNINSTRQLGQILFDKLGLPVVKKTKTGYSTDVDVLTKLAPYHEIVSLILDYRQLTKLKSTYVTGLLATLEEGTDKIHSTFNQTITQTGRLSSTEPNLQNIPIRQQLGREIRRVFIPSQPGFLLIDADYSQIELRVLSHIAGDLAMQKAFLEGMDIHTATAAQVFHVPTGEVTPELRRRAKAVNFGIVYGIGDYSLAEDLGISRKEAKEYIEKYLATYHGVLDYMENTVKEARAKGFVSTLFGRRRYITELNSSNKNTQAFGERCAMNTPIQGTAADIIKAAMVRVFRRLKEERLRAKLLLQVHDELLIEAAPDEIDKVCALLKEEMENAVSLAVPLTVDLHTGKNWYEAKE